MPVLGLEERFWSKVDHDIHDVDRCWMWLGGAQKGYGYFQFTDISGNQCKVQSHRQAYILIFGELESYADGIELDHVCHTSTCTLSDDCPHRRCCNPYHLKPGNLMDNRAPGRVYRRQRTHCRAGHPLDESNTQFDRRGYKVCAECHRQSSRRTHVKKRALTPSKPNWQSTKTHCPHGHHYSEENTYNRPTGGRVCRICTFNRNKNRKERGL